MSETGIVNIKGKEYHTVAKRVSDFRNDYPGWAIKTKIISIDADKVLIRAEILDEDGKLRADGYAEEDRNSTQINRTSAVENCQTSAIGRALASFGLAGTEFASADEVANAIGQQSSKEETDRFKAHLDAVKDWLPTITLVKSVLADYQSDDDPISRLTVAVEAMAEIPDEDKIALWRAPTKGSIWTTEERTLMKSNDWNEAGKRFYGEAA